MPQVPASDDPLWLTPTEEQAWLGAAAFMIRLPSALDAQLQADSELSFFEYMVMAALSQSEGGEMQMSELARLASGSLSRLSHTVARLERQGFMTRERIPGAGRRTRAALTGAGWAKVRAAAPGHVRHVRSLLIDAVTPEQLRALGEIGRTVMHQIDPAEGCPGR